MKKIQDKFSKQARIYKKYRPVYPKEIYTDILQNVKTRHKCWDCGTGNGQVAKELSSYFDTVYATDISQNQIDNATKKSNIIYSLERAEKTSFIENKFDLITVGQAVHWFDFNEFNKEVKRVSKNGGIISIWGYGLLRINKQIDEVIDKFYYDIIGPYWNQERKHVDNEYKSVNFDFEEIILKNKRSIITSWSLAQVEGYFNSWSSIQNYRKANKNDNPVKEVIEQISDYWESNSIKEVKFPIFMRMGKIDK